MDISQIQSQISDVTHKNGAKLPPVEKWNPPFCGDMNLVIKRSGQWWHEGTPFTRHKLVKLFASVLKFEDNKYYLVTPVEKIGIQVEDVPFVVVDDEFTDGCIFVTTQTGDKVLVSESNPIELRRFDGIVVPYCNIRRNLWARVHQNVLYRWVERAHEIMLDDTNDSLKSIGLTSGNYLFSLGEI